VTGGPDISISGPRLKCKRSDDDKVAAGEAASPSDFNICLATHGRVRPVFKGGKCQEEEGEAAIRSVKACNISSLVRGKITKRGQ